MVERLDELEGRINALAQAWMHLAAAAEVAGVLKREPLTHQLRQIRFPQQRWNAEARETLRWLCDRLDAAAEARAETRTRCVGLRQPRPPASLQP